MIVNVLTVLFCTYILLRAKQKHEEDVRTLKIVREERRLRKPWRHRKL
mgnify:CR=1 FL=1|jgi:hypothetical protein